MTARPPAPSTSGCCCDSPQAHPRRARPGDWRQGGPRRRPARRQREGGLASRGRARLATAPSWAAAGPSSRKRAALPPVGSSSSAAAAAACLPSRPSTTPAASGTSALPLRLQVLATAFCDAIGLWEPCTIMLRTSTEGNGSWVVRGLPCKGRSYLLVQGWRLFCQENRLKEGDICTFNVIETTMWDVIITRHKEKMNQFCDGTPKSKKYMSSTDAKKRVQGSMTYLNKARTKGAFEIGPPAWIKEINTSIIENQQLNLSLPFCEAIGLQQHCTITLKTSTRSTK